MAGDLATPSPPAGDAESASDTTCLLALAQRCAQDNETHELERARIERYRRALGQAAVDLLGGIREDRLLGAFSRGTAVRPFLNLDLFVVLDDARHFKHLSLGPRDLLQGLRGAARRVRGARVRAGAGSPVGAVRVDFDRGALGFALRPAFREPYVLGGLTIPSRTGLGQGGWIRANPGALLAVLQQVEAGFGPLLRPALRLCRLWNSGYQDGLSALHLEVLALAGCAGAGPPADLLDALALALGGVARGVTERAAGLLPVAQIHDDLDAALTPAARQALRGRAGEALASLALAREAEGAPRGHAGEPALRAWRLVFTRGGDLR